MLFLNSFVEELRGELWFWGFFVLFCCGVFLLLVFVSVGFVGFFLLLLFCLFCFVCVFWFFGWFLWVFCLVFWGFFEWKSTFAQISGCFQQGHSADVHGDASPPPAGNCDAVGIRRGLLSPEM